MSNITRPLLLFVLVALFPALVAGKESLPRTIRHQGTFVHEPSTISFPEWVGKFRLMNITKFDKAGEDVGVRYFIKDRYAREIQVTVYVYPWDKRSLGAHMDAVVKEIKKAYKKVKVLERDKKELKILGLDRKGLSAKISMLYSFGNVMTPSISLVELFVLGGWTLKFRITYSKFGDKKTETLAAEFSKRLLHPQKDGRL